MTVERLLRLTAGCVVGGSLILGLLHSPYWFGLTGFVSLNLIQSAFTDQCPAKWFYEKVGFEPCDATRETEPVQST